jgi:hypothetical protein
MLHEQPGAASMLVSNHDVLVHMRRCIRVRCCFPQTCAHMFIQYLQHSQLILVSIYEGFFPVLKSVNDVRYVSICPVGYNAFYLFQKSIRCAILDREWDPKQQKTNICFLISDL